MGFREFKKDLREAINRNGIDSKLGIEDHRLAEVIVNQLKVLNGYKNRKSKIGFKIKK